MESEHAPEFERVRRQAMEDLTWLETRLDMAIAWEREQCAKVADRYSEAGETIAAEIRARNYEGGEPQFVRHSNAANR